MSSSDGPAAAARRQQQVEELCIAAIRAIAGERDLHFRARRLHRGRRALPRFAPHLHPSLDADDDDFGSFRGAADGLALRLKHSDPALHASLLQAAASDAAERLVFDLLEQLRVESLAADAGLAGVVHNLRHRHEAWSMAFHGSGLADTARGLLLYTLAQMARARISAEPVVEATEDFIEATRYALGPVIGTALAACKRHRHDQAAYALHALAIARDIGAMLRGSGDEAERNAASDREADDPERAAFSLMMDLEDTDAEVDAVASVVGGASRVLDDSDGGYRVFTRAHDQQRRAASLLRPALLAGHREQLDRRIAAQRINLSRLVRDLQSLLGLPEADGWEAAQEAGRIDGSRLAQLIASPAERRVFRSERETRRADAVATVLIDCSGSMRAHAESVAMLADTLARALELAGAQSEVLGFSTGAWNGGRAMRDWVCAGRPPRPGRLNEALHLVFKDADTPWRRARRDIAALLEPSFFREGIDGEAVQWACARLRERDARLRLLLVVSDGCPMDSATELANDRHCLDQHLREVVADEEARGGVAIFGIGVGLDLSPYYQRSQAIELGARPGNEVFAELLRMLGGHRLR